ncbi:hypothetical protein [Pseudomonas sp. LRF_L74]|uniref:hypothetical protein n=1 Tax=Pseudomonas sp. LRF_L74 TaxID=3369422 RepID=UPI003F62BA00
MFLFFDIFAKAFTFDAEPPKRARDGRSVIHLESQRTKARRARRQEADAACWGK